MEPAVAVSNQTVIADEANYREALALINEARAGLFPTVTGNASIVHSSPPKQGSSAITTLTAEGWSRPSAPRRLSGSSAGKATTSNRAAASDTRGVGRD